MEQENKIFERWRTVISEYDRRSITAKEFCKKYQISYHQIVYWRSKLSSKVKNGVSKNKFVKLEPSSVNPPEVIDVKKDINEILVISTENNRLKIHLNLHWDF